MVPTLPLPQCMVTHLVVMMMSDEDDSVYVSFRAVFVPDYFQVTSCRVSFGETA